jgi:hypothetical protein
MEGEGNTSVMKQNRGPTSDTGKCQKEAKPTVMRPPLLPNHILLSLTEKPFPVSTVNTCGGTLSARHRGFGDRPVALMAVDHSNGGIEQADCHRSMLGTCISITY